MTPEELIERIAQKVAHPLGRTFTRTMLEDLVKDGLIEPAERIGNEGVRPIYRYGWRDYHQVTFIVLLQARGMASRDAIRIRLFLAGRKIPIDDVRQALLREYAKLAAKLNNQTRSAYLDNRREIPPKHRQALVDEIGDADHALKAAGLQTPADVAIGVLRTARQDYLQDGSVSAVEIFDLVRAGANMETLAHAVMPMMSGMFLMGGNPEARALDSIESFLANVTAEQFAIARATYRMVLAGFHSQFGLLPIPDTPEGHLARRKILRTLRRQPQFIALFFAIALRTLIAPTHRQDHELMERLAQNPVLRDKFVAAQSDAQRAEIVLSAMDELMRKRDSHD